MTSRFTVIKGGRDIPTPGNTRTFVSGFATTTRLMGVIGMELVWDVLTDNKIETMHQIFYIDSEEYGIESYLEAYGDNPDEIAKERSRLLGALGGVPVQINEKESRFLLQSAILTNYKYNQELPENREKFAFLMKPEQTLTIEEYRDLFSRITGEYDSAYYVINYYLMRCVSGDERGTAWLTSDFTFENPDCIKPSDSPIFDKSSVFMENGTATLCKNNIELHGSAENNTFLCESLVEFKNYYKVVLSEIVLTDSPRRVLRSEKRSEFKITTPEAAMQMNRSEFITVYEVLDNSENFFEEFSSFAVSFTETPYDNGKLYIDFNSTNSHVNKPVYMINNDINSMFYVTDFGQILVMAYSFEAAQEAALHMSMKLLPYPLILNMKYEFKEPILYEFIQSDFEDFDDFIAFLQGPDPEEEN